MGTLRKLKLAMKMDKDLRKLMVRGSRNEILIDLDGDKEADIALQDINSDGNIDRFAFDLTGDGFFNLYVDDTDMNGIPDHIFLVQPGEEEDDPDQVVQVASGEDVEKSILAVAAGIETLLEAEEIFAQALDDQLRQLDKEIRKARFDLALRK